MGLISVEQQNLQVTKNKKSRDFFQHQIFATYQNGNVRAVRWVNLGKLVIGFLNFWTDVLFTILVYDEWKDSNDDVFLILLLCSLIVILVHWIDQLVSTFYECLVVDRRIQTCSRK